MRKAVRNIGLTLMAAYFVFFDFSFVRADEKKLSLTVTPPLFQMSLNRGSFWQSAIKVVNVNSYDLTVYPSVVNFEVLGEDGQGRFVPPVGGADNRANVGLANWIEISKEPVAVARKSSTEIPFSIRVPPDAEPGGHYAAVLVGTAPLDDGTADGPLIRVSSMVSSLLFARVAGALKESGFISEFYPEKSFYQEPEVNFILRFTNNGNVHLQPQGSIVIYDMWGKERGQIPINQKSDFGNVLPQSIRKFVFEWEGEPGIFESGRYRAVATLSFGQDGRRNVYGETYFWVMPLKPILGAVSGLILFILLAGFLTRAYIRKSLFLAQQELALAQVDNFEEKQKSKNSGCG